MEYVLNRATPTGVNVHARFNEHIGCGDDVGDRGVTGIISCDPDGNGNVVLGATESYGK